MKFKKLVAALSAVTMLGSLVVAVPASAKTADGTTGAVAATVSAQVRANDNTWATKNEGGCKNLSGKSDQIVIENKNAYIVAYYSFDKLNIPEGATVTSAILTVNKMLADFKDVKFVVKPTTAYSTYNIDNIFNAIQQTETSDSGVSQQVEMTDQIKSQNDSPLTADVTSIFDKSNSNAYYVWIASGKKYNVKADATLTVTYTYDDGTIEDPVAQVGDRQYADFNTAWDSAKSSSGNTIKLFKNITIDNNKRLNDFIGNIGIEGVDEKREITQGTTNSFLFEVDNKTLTLKNLSIFAKGNYTINMKHNAVLNADSVTFTRPNADNIAKPAINLDNATATLTNCTVESISLNGNYTLTIDTNTTINMLALPESFTDGQVIVKGTGLSADKVTTLYNSNNTELKGYHLEAVDEGLAVKKDVAEPTTKSEYFSFDAGDGAASYSNIFVTAKKNVDGDEKSETKSVKLGPIVTGGSFYLCITDVPTDVTINSVTLE